MSPPIQDGRNATTHGIAIFFTVTSIVFVTLRLGTRVSIKAIGLDDWLIIPGLVSGVICYICVILGCEAGLGHRDVDLDPVKDLPKIFKYVYFFSLTYVIAGLFVKLSIGVSLIRLATNKTMLRVLYGLMAVSVVQFLILFLAALLQCRPISAAWNGQGKCTSESILIGIAWTGAILSIILDCTFSVIPFIILWSLQMKTRVKITIGSVLSLSFLAAGVTIVRVPYVSGYFAKHDLAYNFSMCILLIVVETGVSLIVSSAPGIKPLFRGTKLFGGSTRSKHLDDSSKKHSIGLNSMNNGSRNRNYGETVLRASSDMDSESTRDIIVHDKVRRAIHITVEHEPAEHPKSFT